MNLMEVDLAILTPSFARTIVPGEVRTLKTLVLAGEAVSLDDFDTWGTKLRLINGYGVSECCVCSTLSDMTSEGRFVNRIGRGIGANTWITEVTDHNRLSPVGAVGELLIEGPLARGYLNDSAKTAAAFIENPAWSKKYGVSRNVRLYKTGDLVRYNTDGTLSIMGRIDSMLKLHGQRLDINEVEQTLRENIPEATVAADVTKLSDEETTSVLIAYICFDGQDIKDDKCEIDLTLPVRRRLASAVACFKSCVSNMVQAYKIPSIYLAVSCLPLTASGKIDRRRLADTVRLLPAPQLKAYSAFTDFEWQEPSTDIEIQLRVIWANLLSIEPRSIAANHNFFSLGADSITVIKLIAALRHKKLLLNATDIFDSPILSDMAQKLNVQSNFGQEDYPLMPFCLIGGLDGLESIYKEVIDQCGTSQDAIQDVYPLSPLQEGLMALSMKHPGTYVAQNILKLPGSLNTERFKAAWQMTVESIPILRTRIIQTSSHGLLQVVLQDPISWSTEVTLEPYIAEDKRVPMRFGDRLNRFATSKQADCLYFVWTAHHSIYDAWSVQQIYHHVDGLYKDQNIERPIEFNKYIDFLTRSSQIETEDFWRLQATDQGDILPVFPTLPYASYQPRPDTSLQYEIDLSQNKPLKAIMSTIIYAAWAILQSQYCGTTTVVSGITLNSRNISLPRIDMLVGPTIATVPFKLTIDWNCSVDEFLAGIQAQSLSMIPYQHMGLQNIRQLGPEAEALCNFQNILIIQPSTDMDLPCGTEGFSGAVNDLSSFNNYALMLECQLRAGRLSVTANFDKKTIDIQCMERILHQFGHIVNQLDLAEQDKRLSDIELVSPDDMKDIMALNQIVPAVNESYLHHLIEKQIRSRPGAAAIHDWDGSELTYRQLDDLSSRLARYLVLKLRMTSEQVVPLCFERSRWTVVMILSVLKAGGVCCLLDPAHPTQRLLDIVASTKTSIVLSSPQYQEIFANHVPNVLPIHPTFLADLPATTSTLNVNVSSKNAAFIIFTSGTTGQPKGIVLTHEAISTSILAYATSLNISHHTRILNFASYSFDMSINEILASLICGGVLCIPSDYDRLNGITHSINTLQVNWAFFTPSFVRSIQPEEIPSLKTLVLGGERILQDDVNQWASKVQLICAYGPTECQVCVLGPLDTSCPSERIGFASGCVGWITDLKDYERLAPIGAIGELVIQGPIITRGYLHNDMKTEASTIVDPIWLPKNDMPQRLYKTGDLVHYLTDGSFAYIGRRDAQIKFYGQRVELNEIEHHLRRHLPPDVEVAVTVFSPVAQRDRQILAVFIASSGKSSIQEEMSTKDIVGKTQLSSLFNGLSVKLSEWLPKYMIPSYYIPIDTIPLTMSGKTDREKLKRLGSKIPVEDLTAYHERGVSQVAPTTEMEVALRNLWGRVLRIKSSAISTECNFFQLGGDSILAIRLSSMARSGGILLTVADIFANPQLRRMASILASIENDSSGDLSPFTLLSKVGPSNKIIEEAIEQCGAFANDIEDIYPCTPLQEGLLALSQESEAYIARSVYKLPVDLDLIAFMAAWEQTAKTNSILRTSIIQSASMGLLQVITKEDIPWTFPDIIDDYLETDKQTPMQLGKRLNRWALVNSSTDQAHYFIWTSHHASFDGWTLPQILQQVENLYRGISPRKPLPYNKFVQYLKDQDTSASQKYWISELNGAPPSRFPPTTIGYKAKPSALLKQSMTFAKKPRSDFTTSTLLRAAWAIVLGKHTESTDVTFGATLTGRNGSLGGIERITGPTITTVPLRVEVARDHKVAEFLSRIQAQASRMIPHEHTGLQNIRRMSVDAYAACDFQNLLVIQPHSLDQVAQESCIHIPHVPYSQVHPSFSTYALTIECKIASNDVVLISASYDPALVDASQMRRILYQFEHVTKQLALEEPQMTIHDIETLSPQDKAEILSWNSVLPTVTESCIHHLIEEVAREQPTKPAVCSSDEDLSYGELEELSSRLAYHLSILGVGPEVMVPLCFEKSVWMVVSIVAVMKAGGCFVPLDPSHPPQRLKSIIEELRTPNLLLLTSAKSQAMCSSIAPTVLVVAESNIQQLISPTPSWWSCPHSSPENALYVMFTSGTSSGTPKGVVIEHKNYSAAAHDRRRYYMLDQNSRVLQFSSYTFDVAMDDILGTLTTSGCICIVSDEERMSDTDIVQAMNRMGVNQAHLTPSFVNLIGPESVPALKVLVLTGEPMTQAHVQTWAHRLLLINAYGPTECSVTSMLNYNVGLDTNPKNIGRSIGSVSWVVDAADHNELCSIGCVGELLTEGPIVSRGYLNDPEKTASAFIECPAWSKNLGRRTRLYKTGDLVQYNSDGTMIYIGRKDSDTQIKINGQRVELGEIEYRAKLALPGATSVVAEMIVPTRATGQKSSALAVFVILDHMSSPVHLEQTGSKSSRSRLAAMINDTHAQLAQSMPPYMVPNIFIPLVRIPLNASGKVDRRKLRQIGSELQKEDVMMPQPFTKTGRMPSTGLEKCLEGIWKKVLNIPYERISADTPFLSLGGDSISAMQVVGMCRKQDIPITTYAILKYQTISQISKHVNSTKVSNYGIVETENGGGTSFDLSPVQRTFFQLMPQGNNLMQQGFLLRLSKVVQKLDLSCALEAIIGQHPMLRARFKQSPSGSWIQYITEEITTSYCLHDERLESLQDIHVATSAAEKAINLQTGPMLGASLVSVNNGQLLFLTIHHLVVDLVSWRIILNDLEELLQYSAPPTKEPLQFQTWCRLQAEYSRWYLDIERSLPSGWTTMDLDYWGMTGKVNLYEDTVTESFSLDQASSSKLLVDCNSPLRTEPLEIILAAIVLSFRSLFADRGPPALSNESHGREPWNEALDLSRTVGWFTTICPTNIPIEAEHDILEAVRLTKDIRRGIPGNGWPYFTSANLNHKVDKSSIKQAEAEILVNFGGRYQQLERDEALFQLMPFDRPGYGSPGSKVERFALFEVSVAIHQGQAHFYFAYNQHMLKQDRIRAWIQKCQTVLKEAVVSLSQARSEYTLSDFPLIQPKGIDIREFTKVTLPSLGLSEEDIEDIYPLSPMQRMMLSEEAKASGFYQAVTTWEATPAQHSKSIDVIHLQAAWQKVIDRHTILRTVFVENNFKNDREVLQIVVKHQKADIICTDTTEQLNSIGSLFDDPRYNSQATAGKPLHRMILCRKPTNGAIICKLEAHHALMDGASMAVLLRDLSLAYDDELPMQTAPPYSRYIHHLQNRRSANVTKDFWTEYLNNVTSCHLPTSMKENRSSDLGTQRSVHVDLSESLQDRLPLFCKEKEVTISTLFQTVWALVLRTQINLDKICFGYLVSGRDIPLEGIEQAVGPFFKLLVSGSHIPTASTLSSVLESTHGNWVRSLPFQDFSLPEMDGEVTGLFNTLVNFRKYNSIESEGEGDDESRSGSIAFRPMGGYDPFQVSYSSILSTLISFFTPLPPL